MVLHEGLWLRNWHHLNQIFMVIKRVVTNLYSANSYFAMGIYTKACAESQYIEIWMAMG